jgi:dCTP deaminase
MILSDKAIRLNNIVTPCEEPGKFRGKSYGLSCAGYDVRADLSDMPDYVAVGPGTGYSKVMTPDGDGISLKPGQSVLIGLQEHFNVPPGVVGYVRDKSTWSRMGLFTAQAVLEPGWKGYMALRIANLGEEDLTIVDREPIAQVVFHWIDSVPERTYSGKYQGQRRGEHGPRLES